MAIRRRSLLGGAGAFAGSVVSGRVWADDELTITRQDWDNIVLGGINTPRFNCTIAPRAGEGPFYLPSSLERRDITEGHDGEALRLRIRLGGMQGTTECIPMRGAVVDIWHADAHGLYSNIGEGIQHRATPGETFMRGHQVTDDEGNVEFVTTVPGWEAIASASPEGFAARTIHIHVKIFHEWQIFDAQLYFPDELLDALYADVEPYRSYTVVTIPGSDIQIARRRNPDDGQFVGTQSVPMTIDRDGGQLVATAVIGTVAESNRGIPSYHGV